MPGYAKIPATLPAVDSGPPKTRISAPCLVMLELRPGVKPKIPAYAWLCEDEKCLVIQGGGGKCSHTLCRSPLYAGRHDVGPCLRRWRAPTVRMCVSYMEQTLVAAPRNGDAPYRPIAKSPTSRNK